MAPKEAKLKNLEFKELYRQILGIEKPEKVSRVRVYVKLVHEEEVRRLCPDCGELWCMIMRWSGPGVIWAPVSLRPVFSLESLWLIVRFILAGR